MENLTFNIKDITILLGLIASFWALHKIILEIAEPRKALEKRVDALERWSNEDHRRIKELELRQKLVLKTMYYLVEHEITGNGFTDFNSVKREIEEIVFPRKER